MTSVLMVCTGNICRSPAAEAVLQHTLAQAGLADTVFVDSAGTTDFHEGERAQQFSRSVGAHRGYDVSHLSRPFADDDFDRFDLLVVMDGSHEQWLRNRLTRRTNRTNRSVSTAAMGYLRSFDPHCFPTTGLDDPWGRPVSAYERMYDDIEAAIPGLVEYLVQ